MYSTVLHSMENLSIFRFADGTQTFGLAAVHQTLTHIMTELTDR